MNSKDRKAIEKKSDDQLVSDIARYQTQFDKIPRSMATTRISANSRLQANIDEHQKRLLLIAKAQ